MQFKDIIGQESLKKRLLNSVKENRISHAQMFLGKGSVGKFALAYAYAQYINCTNKQESDSCGECGSENINNLATPFTEKSENIKKQNHGENK